MGIFIGSDGCLFAYPDTSSVSQIPQIHVERSSVPVQGTPIQPLDKSLRIYTPYECHHDIPKEKGDNSRSLSRRLASRNQNRRRLLEHRQFILSLINSLGLIINYKKSDLVPAQVFTFIGMEFLTHINIVRVPQNRQMKILEAVRMFSQKTSVSARAFLSLLGQLNAAADLVMLGRLHLWPLQISLHNQWKPQNLPYSHCYDNGNSETSQMVASGRSLSSGDFFEDRSSLLHYLYRCQPVRLGSPRGAGRTSVSWSMDRRPIPAPHQCVRDESNFSLSITSSSQGKEFHCVGVNGQHCSGSLF